MSTITAPTVRVLMTDGAEHEVKLTYKAQMQYGRTARARKWPAVEKATEMATNFMLWYVMCQQLGLYDYTYEEFEDHVEWVSEEDEQELTEDDIDFPTKTSDAA